MNSESAVVALAALAQTSRLAIFRLLIVAGNEGMSVGKIGEGLALPAATLSFHLKELSHAGLIEGKQEGKFVYYKVKFSQMNELMAFMVEHCCDESEEGCGLELPACVADKIRIVPEQKKVSRARVRA